VLSDTRTCKKQHCQVKSLHDLVGFGVLNDAFQHIETSRL